MNIWLAPSAFYPHRGGVEELTLKLAQHYLAAGHTVTVIANQHPLSLPTSETVSGVPVWRFPFTTPGKRPRAALRYLLGRRQLAALLDAHQRPDVLHVQCASSQLPALGGWCRRRGVPLIVTTQGETVMDAGRLYQRSAWMRAHLRLWSTRAAALTACSQWTADRAAELAPAFRSARILYNGVDLDDWSLADPPEDPVVAAWGRIVPQKGFDLLIRAFHRVRAEEPRARLLVGGDGPELEALRAQASDGVDFLGALDRDAVKELLGRARVAVVPSRIEPFGIVAVEALAAGRTVVYSTRGGLPEAVGDAGYGVDPLDTEALAEVVLRALRTPIPAHMARDRAQRFRWSDITKDYLELYDEVLRMA